MSNTISILISLLAAELFVMILRSRDIIVVVKTRQQRTSIEQREVERGILRSILLEAFLFVPASVILFILICRPYLLAIDRVKAFAGISVHAFDGLLGVISYIFPFGSLRQIVREVALRTLRNFAQIVLDDSSKAANTGK